MLALDDPLWRKIDGGGGDVPERIADLAVEWDEEGAKSLFWDVLCHQETCCGATYASIPYLLDIAEPPQNLDQRTEIAGFLGFVAMCAFYPELGSRREPTDGHLQGLPRTAEDAGEPASAHLTENHRAKIEDIRSDFFAALPRIAALCERSFFETLDEDDAARYLLSGIAAADGLQDLARLLQAGADGGVCTCKSCGWQYEYAPFDGRLALYAQDKPQGEAFTRATDDDRLFLDRKDGEPNRADAMVSPLDANEDTLGENATRVLALATRSTDNELPMLVRSFLGRFTCPKCGVQGPVTSL
ncbi:MAG: hypothetical protein ACTS3R_05100 [Inquilinaceae bacterium]